MNGQDFSRMVQEAFAPFLEGLGFQMDAMSISGRFYRCSFSSLSNIVSISYEPGDDVLFIMVFSREDSRLSEIDDLSKTPRLSDLNKRYMSVVTADERIKNEFKFASVRANDEEEMLLLKSAKELSLVLPKYLKDSKHSP